MEVPASSRSTRNLFYRTQLLTSQVFPHYLLYKLSSPCAAQVFYSYCASLVSPSPPLFAHSQVLQPVIEDMHKKAAKRRGMFDQRLRAEEETFVSLLTNGRTLDLKFPSVVMR